MKHSIRATTLAVLLALGLASDARAQLAITEVMAGASRLPTGFTGPDFWELTNFGTNAIDLHDYSFSDNSTNAISHPFTNLTIQAGESIVFCRTNEFVYTPEHFRAWWGETNLRADLRIRFYVYRGFDDDVSDDVWLWDGSGNVVDRVTFRETLEGRSFVYELATGQFGVRSEPAVNGAFRAGMSPNDVGSPGFAPGPVELSVVEQPLGRLIDGCSGAEFRVTPGGLPKPRFQWLSNGVPILGATRATLALSDIPPEPVEYRVVLDNGLTQVISAPAVVNVSTTPTAPAIVTAPRNVELFPGQTARISVEVFGVPCVDYQWRRDGSLISPASHNNVVISIPSDAGPSVSTVSVVVTNAQGSNSASARLSVVRRPCLQITETMPSPTNAAAFGWFELTSCDTREVNLTGYRFRDQAAFAIGAEITNNVIIRPGESIIFVEAMTREEFIRWWGADNLPPDLQVITWGGWGLSDRDVIYLWNPFPSEAWDTVANASQSSTQTNGVSQLLQNSCDEATGCMGQWDRDSFPGEDGAIRAVEGGDVGSPGYTSNPPARVLRITREGFTNTLTCRVREGGAYRLAFKSDLEDPVWTPLGTGVATSSILVLTDTPITPAARRFYRLETLP